MAGQIAKMIMMLLKNNFFEHANSVYHLCNKLNGVKDQKVKIRWLKLIYVGGNSKT